MKTEQTAIEAFLGYRIAANQGNDYEVQIPDQHIQQTFKAMLDRNGFRYEKDYNIFRVRK